MSQDCQVSKVEFQSALSVMAHLFGKKLDPGQKDDYYEQIGPRLRDLDHLRSLFRSMIRTESVFPDPATILEYLATKTQKEIDHQNGNVVYLREWKLDRGALYQEGHLKNQKSRKIHPRVEARYRKKDQRR